MSRQEEWWWVLANGEVQPAAVTRDGDQIEVWLTGSEMPFEAELIRPLESAPDAPQTITQERRPKRAIGTSAVGPK